jgi:hypothetical protein
MKRSSRLLITTAGLLLSGAAAAQVRVDSRVTALVPEAQLEVALPGNDYVLLSYNLVGIAGKGYTTTFDSGQLRAAYEHFWSEHWSGGATVRVVGRSNPGNGDLLGMPGFIIPGVLVRHLGNVGPVTLGQRLAVEYLISPDYYIYSNRKNRALARLRLDAEHPFVLNEQLTLRPRLAYEAAAYLRFQRDEDQLKERVVDFGSLRGEVGVRFSPSFDLTPWVAYQTSYRNSLLFYNAIGDPASGGKVNYRTPVVGLDLRLTVGNVSAERRTLPTQH